MVRFASIAGALVIAAAAVLSSAIAATPMSDWFEGHKHRVRLISGAEPQDSGIALYAAVQIELAKNWKTYWRNPGDAGGIPPSFDWSESRNLKSATVVYPVPSRLTEDLGTSLGYKGAALLPIRLVPIDSSQPVTFRLKLFFGVCEEICIPAEADLTVEVGADDVATMPPALARALALAPEEVPLQAAHTGVDGLKLVSVEPQLAAETPRVVISVSAEGDTAPDVFGYSSGRAMVGVAKPASDIQSGGVRRFELPIETFEVEKLSGEEIRLVISTADRAIETVIRLP